MNNLLIYISVSQLLCFPLLDIQFALQINQAMSHAPFHLVIAHNAWLPSSIYLLTCLYLQKKKLFQTVGFPLT